jgi:hypothetical protein
MAVVVVTEPRPLVDEECRAWLRLLGRRRSLPRLLTGLGCGITCCVRPDSAAKGPTSPGFHEHGKLAVANVAKVGLATCSRR